MPSENQRLQHFDLISGIFMIQIIILHILQFANSFEHNPVFSMVMRLSFFLMPWFFYKSGYFHKQPEKVDLSFYKAKAKRLLLPFLFFSALGITAYIPYNLSDTNLPLLTVVKNTILSFIRDGDPGMSNLPLWFLLSLFFTSVVFSVIEKYNLKWIIVFFPIISFLLYRYSVSLYLGLDNLFLGIFFYYLGYCSKKADKKHEILILIICTIIYAATTYFDPSYLDFKINDLINGNYFLYLLSAISGILLFSGLFKYSSGIRPVNYVGRQSMVYFVLHWPIILLTTCVYRLFSLESSGYLYALVVFIAVFSLIPVLNKILNNKFKVFIGK